MGQNFGVITKITEAEITLRELIQDAGGDWAERESTLLLQEADAQGGEEMMRPTNIIDLRRRARRAWLWAGVRRRRRRRTRSRPSTSPPQGGRVIVRITTKEPLAAPPASFTVTQPGAHRVRLPEHRQRARARTNQEINEGELRSMSVVQVGDRTRMVLNLRNMVTYETPGRRQRPERRAHAGPVAEARPTRARPSAFAEGDADAEARDPRHRLPPRPEPAKGRVVVELSDTTTGIDIRQQGQQLIVDFLKTSLPDNLRKRLDVRRFRARRCRPSSTFQQGENVRMVIEPKGLWEHNAYQTDTQFVVEVKPVQYDPNKLVQGTRGGYRGEKLSLNFQNVEVRSVLNVIADFTDLNIITSDTVQAAT